MTNARSLANFATGIGTEGAVLTVDNTNNRIGIATTNPQNDLQVGLGITMEGDTGQVTFVGIVTAEGFRNSDGSVVGAASTDNIVTGTAATFTSTVSIANSIFHVGDTNTAFGFPANDTFVLRTAGSERVRVDSEGKLFTDRTVSNTTGNHPATEINTDSTGTAADSFATGIDFQTEGTTRNRLAVTTNNNWIFYRDDGSNEALRITGIGSVGIGDATPENTLTIKNIGSFEGDANSFYFGSNFTGTGTKFTGSGKHAQRFFLNNASANGYLRYDNTGTTGNAGDTITWQERFRVTGIGSVGIGSADPKAALDVTGDQSAGYQAQFANSTGSNRAKIYVDGNGAAFVSENFDNGFEVASNTARIYTNGDERLRINSGGLVGIGSVSPKYRIDTGVAAGIGTIRLRSTISGEAAIRIGSLNSDVNLIRVDGDGTAAHGETDNAAFGFGIRYMGSRGGNNNALAIYSDNQTGSEVEAVTVQQNGFVGVNQATPTSRLHVVGDVLVSGITTASQFDATSDVALKENIEVIDEPITKISELKGVTFDWKKGGHSVGVIAQDVEKVLPTAVGGSKDQKTVNYNAIIGLLVESVKDQQKQIEELKSLLDK